MEFGRLNASTVSPGLFYDKAYPSTQIVGIPTKCQELNDLSLGFNEPKVVMTRDQARELIATTYLGQVEIMAE